MKEFKELKKKLIDSGITFRELVNKDGRSYQHLHKQCTDGNKKILKEMFIILKKLTN